MTYNIEININLLTGFNQFLTGFEELTGRLTVKGKISLTGILTGKWLIGY